MTACGTSPVSYTHLDVYKRQEDSHATVDMNVVLCEDGSIIEIQGTGEERPFTRTEYNRMFTMASGAIRQLIRLQKKALGE